MKFEVFCEEGGTNVEGLKWRRTWACLRTFMESTANDMGLPPRVMIGTQPYTVREYRGSGRSCSVYSVEDAAELQGGLIKIYKSEDERKVEEKVLKSLAEKQEVAAYVPRVVASQGQCLVVTPFARHFNNSKGRRQEH